MPATRTNTNLKSKRAKASLQCPTCSTFVSGDLKRHMRTHTAPHIACPYAKEGCMHMDRQMSNMQTHINTVHTKATTFTCPHLWADIDGVVFPCGYEFCDPSSLHKHRQKKHGYCAGDGAKKNHIPTPIKKTFSEFPAQRKRVTLKRESWPVVKRCGSLQCSKAASATRTLPSPPLPTVPVSVPDLDDAEMEAIVSSLSRSSSSSRLSSTLPSLSSSPSPSPSPSPSRSPKREQLSFDTDFMTFDSEFKQENFLWGSNIPADFAAIMAVQSSAYQTKNELPIFVQGGRDSGLDADRIQCRFNSRGPDLSFNLNMGFVAPQTPAAQFMPRVWSYTTNTPGVVPVLDDPAAYGALPAPPSPPSRPAPLPTYGIILDAYDFSALPQVDAYEQELMDMNPSIQLSMGTGIGMGACTYTPSRASSSRASLMSAYPQGLTHFYPNTQGSRCDGIVVPGSPNSFDEYYRGL